LLVQVTSDDILEFGLIPELVGRLPVVSSLGPLNEEALIQVLTEPKNALVRQFQSLFQMEKCELRFTDGALKCIAKKAKEKGTGARGLRSIVEEVMLDIMYELPEQPKGTIVTIDEEMVDGTKKPAVFSMPESKSA
jgi:ATP-dependent Clp protease ATP-binding subunit ClpX